MNQTIHNTAEKRPCPFERSMSKIKEWVQLRYPQCAGPEWRVRFFAWEYNTSDLASEVCSAANKAFQENDEVAEEDLRTLIESTKPPKGYAYIVMQRGSERIGVNVPDHIVQLDTASLEPVQLLDIDGLAQEIRRIDGNHDLGAAALAEALAPYLTKVMSAD